MYVSRTVLLYAIVAPTVDRVKNTSDIVGKEAELFNVCVPIAEDSLNYSKSKNE